ncbi:hypothetical protein BJY59DRAFT_35940 [Rhodotorula toruloides]
MPQRVGARRRRRGWSWSSSHQARGRGSKIPDCAVELRCVCETAEQCPCLLGQRRRGGVRDRGGGETGEEVPRRARQCWGARSRVERMHAAESARSFSSPSLPSSSKRVLSFVEWISLSLRVLEREQGCRAHPLEYPALVIGTRQEASESSVSRKAPPSPRPSQPNPTQCEQSKEQEQSPSRHPHPPIHSSATHTALPCPRSRRRLIPSDSLAPHAHRGSPCALPLASLTHSLAGSHHPPTA